VLYSIGLKKGKEEKEKQNKRGGRLFDTFCWHEPTNVSCFNLY